MCCLLFVLLVIPAFAGQVVVDLAEPVANTGGKEMVAEMPISFTPSRGETLKYDDGVFNNGIGISSSGDPFDPLDWQTYGWATYFVLNEFGITGSRKVGALMVYVWNVTTATDFRLYVWRNIENPPNTLRPWSHFTEFPYDSLSIDLPPPMTWGVWDLSAENIVLPDTFWVGICYNEIAVGSASWFIGVNQNLSDDHTQVNLGGGPSGWGPTIDFPYPYGIRAVVEKFSLDVAPVALNIDTLISIGTYSVGANVKNFGLNTASSFDVTCEIEPGGYSSTETISSLAPDDSVLAIFSPDFTFGEGIYTVTVYTQLAGDENPYNDTLEREIVAVGIAEGGETTPKAFMFRTPTIINNGQVNIELTLPIATTVELAVYDALGRLRETLVSKRFSAGDHTVNVQLNLPTGVYFYSLKTRLGENVVEKFLLVK